MPSLSSLAPLLLLLLPALARAEPPPTPHGGMARLTSRHRRQLLPDVVSGVQHALDPSVSAGSGQEGAADASASSPADASTPAAAASSTPGTGAISISDPLSGLLGGSTTPSSTPAATSGATSAGVSSPAVSGASSPPVSSTTPSASSASGPSSPPPASSSSKGAVAVSTSLVSASSASGSATAPAADDSSSSKSSSGGMGKTTIIAIAAVGGAVGGGFLLFTIIRKTRFSASKRFQEKLNPIDFGDEVPFPPPANSSTAALGGAGAALARTDSLGSSVSRGRGLDEKSDWGGGHGRQNSGGTDYGAPPRGLGGGGAMAAYGGYGATQAYGAGAGYGMAPPQAPGLQRNDSGMSNGSGVGRQLMAGNGIPRSNTPGYYPPQPSGLPNPYDQMSAYGGSNGSVRRGPSPAPGGGGGGDPYYRGGY